MLFDPGIIDAIRNTLPGLEDFFLLISNLGSELVYIGLLLIGYWTYNKRESIVTAFVLLTAIVSNYWLKVTIANDRPPSGYWTPGADTPNYSTPSGHSHYSATFYGWLTARAKTYWMAIIAIVLTGLIGISRIYLGVHFLGDVLLGWGVGIITVLLFFYFETPAREFLSRFNTEILLLLLAVIGFLMTFVSSILPPPPDDNFGANGGFLVGLAIGLILERRFVDFTIEPHNGQRWRLVLRAVIGLVLVIGVLLGLEPLFPSDLIWLRMTRYFIATVVGILVWPYIFKKANL
jgi:membrane-associated phospholipid phosphatase